MSKGIRAALLIILIIGPIVFYNSLNKKNSRHITVSSFGGRHEVLSRPKIALIFDDFGESLSDLKEVYSLDIPLTVSVIPNLKFSKNIAHIALRCGFSVFIHLPLEPAKANYKGMDKYRFISSSLSRRDIIYTMRQYLNSIRVALGVNNHMGSKATEDPQLMEIILKEIKKKNLIFVDSRTSTESIAYKIAQDMGLICGFSSGFLDPSQDAGQMQKQMNGLIEEAKEKGKIIAIAHPKKSTLKFLKENLPAINKQIEFITIEDYFNL